MTTRPDPRHWGLYAITDESLSRGRTHAEIAAAAIAGGADVVQLRDKTSWGRRLYDMARRIRALTHDAGVAFVMNDRVDIGMAVGAEGVHVGVDDLPPDATRTLIGPDRILGLSARNVNEAIEAERQGADYIGFGPIYEARKTKPDTADPTGLEALKQVCERVQCPVIAIGGITLDNVAEVIRAGADGVAIISAIVAADDIATTTRQFKERIAEAKASVAR
ncbi:MAG: thiamine phosphate synthase [candidate division Zixibacteria bacterium]|nr:thiamine phosphate synthase [candidate division Zixibacteria bacterium]